MQFGSHSNWHPQETHYNIGTCYHKGCERFSCKGSPIKRALVTLLLKKSTLDPQVHKHYRPVSNLPFISKVLERVVLRILFDYLSDIKQYEPHQSAYRSLHSTETSLMIVANDILIALEEGSDVSPLVLISGIRYHRSWDTAQETLRYRHLGSSPRLISIIFTGPKPINIYPGNNIKKCIFKIQNASRVGDGPCIVHSIYCPNWCHLPATWCYNTFTLMTLSFTSLSPSVIKLMRN